MGGFGAARAVASIVRHEGRGSAFLATLQLAAVLALAALAVWGALTVVLRRRRRVAEANAFLLFCLVLTPALAELGLRAGIALGLPSVRRPLLYANPYTDDDFFKLVRLWQIEAGEGSPQGISPIVPDPLLGWSYARTPENPLGALSDRPTPLAADERTLLFYGDSFVARGEPMAAKLPQQLDARLPGVRVVNLGVSGYGFDQIVLRVRETHAEVPGASLVVGVFTEDLDRCILTYRNHPKPWFEVEGDALVLRGVPVASSSEAHLERHPLGIRSFFLAALRRAASYLTAGASTDVDARREDKERIASLLVAELARIAREGERELLVVVFSPSSGGGWRKQVLTDALRRSGLRFVDAESVLGASEAGFAASFDASGHHHAEANALLADAIARALSAGRGTAP